MVVSGAQKIFKLELFVTEYCKLFFVLFYIKRRKKIYGELLIFLQIVLLETDMVLTVLLTVHLYRCKFLCHAIHIYRTCFPIMNMSVCNQVLLKSYDCF